MIKLGSVSFLNAKPITYGLDRGLVENDFEIIATPPSKLSGLLSAKEIDLGLIPVAEFLKRGNYSVVPDISISSMGDVDSVLLLLNKDLKQTKTVAVDERSQSSTALLRIVLEIFYGISPKYISRDIRTDFFGGVDGGMLIGDAGLKTRYDPPSGYDIIDLGKVWTEETDLPFVYAVFAVNEGVKLGRNYAVLHESKALGLGKRREIAEVESANIGIDEDICFNYLSEKIRYDLGDAEIKGMIQYSKYLAQLGLSEEIQDVRKYSDK